MEGNIARLVLNVHFVSLKQSRKKYNPKLKLLKFKTTSNLNMISFWTKITISGLVTKLNLQRAFYGRTQIGAVKHFHHAIHLLCAHAEKPLY